MKYATLPPTLNKKDEEGNPLPNIVKVTNNVRYKDDVKDKKDENGKPLPVPPLEIEVAAERFEFKQFENLSEFIQDAGGEAEALTNINDMTRNAATSAGKVAIRTASSGTVAQIIEAGLRACKNFTWKVEEVLSLKERASAFDELARLKKELSPEEFQKRLAEFF